MIEIMEELSKEKALEIVAHYLAGQGYGELSFADEPLDNVYGIGKPEDYYYIHILDSWPLRIGGDRIICISKITGKIVFDGCVGE